MGHKGFREFTSDEVSSIAISQNGFTFMTGEVTSGGASGSYTYGVTYHAGVSGTDTSTNKYFPNITYWSGLHNPYTVAGDAGLQARSYGKGDDFAKNGIYDNGAYANNLGINAKDVIYGAFDKVFMDDLNEKIIAIIGK